jgi:hypothetical protein
MFSSTFIILCIVLFTLFNIVSVFFFKETYGIQSISVPSVSIAWGILKNHGKYSLWWNHFANLEEQDILYKIELKEKIDNNLLKFKYILDAETYEVWTFFLKTKDDDTFLEVKKEFYSSSKTRAFKHKFVKNDRHIEQFFNNFKKAYKSIDETSYS